MAMTANASINQAKEAIQNGRFLEARQLLRKVTRLDPQNHTAWLWLASVADTPQQALAYVQQAEKLRPNDPIVLEALVWAKGRLPVVVPSVASATLTAVPHITAVSPPSHTRKPATWIIIALLFLIPIFWFGKSVWSSMVSTTGPVQIAGNNALASESVERSDENGLVLDLTQTAVSPSAYLAEATVQPPAAEEAATTEPTPTLEPTNTHTPVPTSTNTPEPTVTAEPTETAVPTEIPPIDPPPAQAPIVRPAGVSEDEHWIDVSLANQTLVAYEGETAVFTSIISSGTWDHPTVTGQFRTWLKHESQTMNGYLLGYDYFLEDVPYVMYFYNDYAIHGTYWHDNFGTPMSHGCVNTPTEDAGWLFDWAPIGTLVNVHQ